MRRSQLVRGAAEHRADSADFHLAAAAVAKVQFPEMQWDPESLYLASLFHDLGCTAENIAA